MISNKAKVNKRPLEDKQAKGMKRLNGNKQATTNENISIEQKQANESKRTIEDKQAILNKRPIEEKQATGKKGLIDAKQATIKDKQAIIDKKPIKDKQDLYVAGLVRLFYDIQKVRVGLGLKVNNQESKLSPEHRIAFQELYNNYEAEEKKLYNMFKEHVVKHPLYVIWLSKVKGIDVTLSACFLFGGIDIRRATNPSKLQRYCGLGVVDGKAERITKGESLHYNPFLKLSCWKLGKSFEKLKNNPRSGYGRLLLDALKKYEKHACEECNNDERKTTHINAMARRKVVSIFIHHLWEQWRRIEGLDTGVPYSFTEFGGRHSMNDYIPPFVDDIELN